MKPDEVAIQILQKYQPVLLDTVVPLSVIGDGNCMYRASSLGVFGTEDYHTLLRLLVSIEIIMNPHSYDIGSSGCLVADQRVVSSPYPALLKAALTKGQSHKTISQSNK